MLRVMILDAWKLICILAPYAALLLVVACVEVIGHLGGLAPMVASSLICFGAWLGIALFNWITSAIRRSK